MKHYIYKGKRRIYKNIERRNLICDIACETANLVLEAMMEDIEGDTCNCPRCVERRKYELILSDMN